MINFNQLSPDFDRCQTTSSAEHAQKIQQLWRDFHQNPISKLNHATAQIGAQTWQNLSQKWQAIKDDTTNEQLLTDSLIELFNLLFDNPHLEQMPTTLVRGSGEPEYFPSDDQRPARIEFAHGFFQSALHEISHWCIAGKNRRKLNDFGYWYESDGRDAHTQALFEQVEIKPQAVEALLTLACGRYFYVSQDNLNADFDTSKSTFGKDVLDQAQLYLSKPQTLPSDAQVLLWVFLALSHPNYHTSIR